MQEQEDIVIEYGSKMVVLKILPFDSELNIDDILRIDYYNLMGEILTFPLMFNRIANFKAEIEEIVQASKFDLEVFEAQLMEEKRKVLEAQTEKKITISEVESAVKTDARFAIKKKEFFKRQKELAYMDALYWAAQSKDTKLNRMSEKLRPEDFEKELVEDTINGVMIKMSKKSIN